MNVNKFFIENETFVKEQKINIIIHVIQFYLIFLLKFSNIDYLILKFKLN